MEDGIPRLTRVAIVGAGWAGCAAAVTLARLGRTVTLYEAAPVAGGRARRVVRAGLALDNGQHLMLGAYVQTRNVLAAVHGGDGESRLVRMPLAVTAFPTSAAPFSLTTHALPGGLGFLSGLLASKGLTVRERVGLVAWFRRLARQGFRCDAARTVDQLVADGPAAAARLLWYPLCLAALNTPPERASAQIFANVLRASFAGGTGASDFLLATTDLSAAFPEAAIRFVHAHGGRVELGRRVRIVADAAHVAVVARDARETYDGAVVAVGPHQFIDVVGDQAAFAAACDAARALDYEPITTVWLGYGVEASLPAPIVRLDDAPGQWIVDRRDILVRAATDASRPPLAMLVAIVISARGPHDGLDHAALASACDAQLRRLAPGWPALAWSQTIVEKRATYACVPGRPLAPSVLPHPRVALAGDWLDTEFPATLEAAVRSGVAAAFALEEALVRRS